MTPRPDGTPVANEGSPLDHSLALPPATPVGARSTTGVAVMAHLRRQTRELVQAHALLEGDSPDAVHAARVAARRLRSGLRVYGDLLRDDIATQLRPELSWYAGRLSPARDLEVFDLWLRSPDGDTDAQPTRAQIGASLIPWLRRRREHVLHEALVELRSERAAALLDLLVAVARAPRFTRIARRRASTSLAPRVLRADRQAARPLGHLRPDDSPEAWHRARISAKRARYAAEVGASALGRPCAELAHLWASISEPLGEAQDATIQRTLVLERVSDASTPLSAAEAFTFGIFVASTRHREVACHREARNIWLDARHEHARIRRAMSGIGV